MNETTKLLVEYEDFVASRFKMLSTPIESLLHGAVGVSGEAGECLDAVKKAWIYGKELDMHNMIEEIGDQFFYQFAMLRILGVSFEAVIRHNMDKLSKRYPEGYSDAAAIARADKQPEFGTAACNPKMCNVCRKPLDLCDCL